MSESQLRILNGMYLQLLFGAEKNCIVMYLNCKQVLHQPVSHRQQCVAVTRKNWINCAVKTDSVVSVSYTHLDVYKRQGVY